MQLSYCDCLTHCRVFPLLPWTSLNSDPQVHGLWRKLSNNSCSLESRSDSKMCIRLQFGPTTSERLIWKQRSLCDHSRGPELVPTGGKDATPVQIHWWKRTFAWPYDSCIQNRPENILVAPATKDLSNLYDWPHTLVFVNHHLWKEKHGIDDWMNNSCGSFLEPRALSSHSYVAD